MFKTNEWLEKANACSHNFVDQEVEQMALAAVKTRIAFRYLHIILDNVAPKFEIKIKIKIKISNEQLKGILYGRDQLINQLLGTHLDSM